MRVAVVGAGFVGVPTALRLGELGHRVRLVDRDPKRVRLLGQGRLPFREAGLERILRRALRSGRFEVRAEYGSRPFDVYVICVGTPSRRDGSADLRGVQEAASAVGRHVRSTQGIPLVAVKSTVPPGTLDRRVVPMLERASRRRLGQGFLAASVPEFLREGHAWEDTMRPERLVFGARHELAFRRMRRLFGASGVPRFETDPPTAELVKYASNAFLALKVSFANELARWSTALGVDAYEVVRAVGADPRIGSRFLRAGAGFGGSCLPKDLRALRALARSLGEPARLVDATLAVNESQARWVLALAERALGGLRGRRVALLGLSFKENTDDVRESVAIVLYRGLLARGARVTAWDPAAGAAFARAVQAPVRLARSLRAALRDQDAALIQTEWAQLKEAPPELFRREMRRPIVIDGRRSVDPEAFEQAGVKYYGVGWRRVPVRARPKGMHAPRVRRRVRPRS